MTNIGITVTEHGAGIVSVERGETDTLLVVGIERLPFDLGAVAARVRALTGPDHHYTIDAEGLGSALWAVLGHAGEPGWTLYTGRGTERQALVDELLVAIEQDRFRFAAGLAEQAAMSTALAGYCRVVGADGVIGSELVTALLLAIIKPFRSVYEDRGLFIVGGA